MTEDEAVDIRKLRVQVERLEFGYYQSEPTNTDWETLRETLSMIIDKIEEMEEKL